MTKVICLDLGNVLIPFDYRRFFRRIAKRSSLSEEQIQHRFRETQLPALYESGKMSSRDFYAALCLDLHATLGYKDFCDTWSSIFDRKAGIRAAFLHALAKNYTLILLSNTNEIHFSFLDKHFPLLRAFHHFALSFQVGVMKPGQGIYEAALRMGGARPEEVFYADDIEEYVAGARRLGLHSVRVQSGEELITQLAQHGLQLSPGLSSA